MISYLAVNNVSVIEKVNIEFSSGLSVLTGETGSGKSVLVGALKLLLGERFQRTMLREGADKLRVEAIFTDIGNSINKMPIELVEQYELKRDDDLTIRREVEDNGKNRIFINGHVATVGQLRELAPFLADIHGQHEHQTLLDESRHIELIDHMVPFDKKERFLECFRKYDQSRLEYNRALNEIASSRQLYEMLTFQYNEIASAHIDLSSDSELDERISLLSHIEKVRLASTQSLEALSDGEGQTASEQLSVAIRSLDAISRIVPEVNSMVTALRDSLEVINEVTMQLFHMQDMQEASPEQLDSMIQRKYLLQDLIMKYGTLGSDGVGSLESVIDKGNEIRKKLDTFDNSDEYLGILKGERDRLLSIAQMEADDLLEVRRRVSEDISKQVIRILAELELPNSEFTAEFIKKNELDVGGGVECRFNISVNPGFPPAPLAQVASGGEISRVMLALKEVFSDSDSVGTLLFDEIDAGISGKAAKRVAQKLKSLGEKKQVIVITHLPVVAAAGKQHYAISKSIDVDIAKTDISLLDNESRKGVIASMIAGQVTESSIKQAEELMRLI